MPASGRRFEPPGAGFAIKLPGGNGYRDLEPAGGEAAGTGRFRREAHEGNARRRIRECSRPSRSRGRGAPAPGNPEFSAPPRSHDPPGLTTLSRRGITVTGAEATDPAVAFRAPAFRGKRGSATRTATGLPRPDGRSFPNTPRRFPTFAATGSVPASGRRLGPPGAGFAIKLPGGNGYRDLEPAGGESCRDRPLPARSP